MPVIAYKTHRFSPESQAILDSVLAVLTDYEQQGYSLSLRQTFYQMVTRNLIPNTEKSYNKLGDLIANAREAGLVDWDHIEDRGRSVQSLQHWDSPEEIISACAKSFRYDLWTTQPTRIEVFVEKDALSDVVGRACNPYDVPYFANKGYASASSLWNIAYYRYRNYMLEGQNVLIIHLGDHDPSGIDMTRDIEERLILYAAKDEFEREDFDGKLTVRRIALNMDQVREYNPPPNPAKAVDPRFADYQRKFGDESWELDALQPQTIVELIQGNILNDMDEAKYNARLAEQQKRRDELREMSTNYGAVTDFLKARRKEHQDDQKFFKKMEAKQKQKPKPKGKGK